MSIYTQKDSSGVSKTCLHSGETLYSESCPALVHALWAQEPGSGKSDCLGFSSTCHSPWTPPRLRVLTASPPVCPLPPPMATTLTWPHPLHLEGLNSLRTRLPASVHTQPLCSQSALSATQADVLTQSKTREPDRPVAATRGPLPGRQEGLSRACWPEPGSPRSRADG